MENYGKDDAPLKIIVFFRIFRGIHSTMENQYTEELKLVKAATLKAFRECMVM